MFEIAVSLFVLQYETFKREKLDMHNSDKSLAPFGNLVEIHSDKKLSMSGSASYLFPTPLQMSSFQKVPNLSNTPHEPLYKICLWYDP